MPPKFVPRERKHKKLARKPGLSNPTAASASDTNVSELTPTSKDERDERKRQLRAELEAQKPLSRASSKKRKRLDKYLDTKLKKEENLELIKELEKQSIDTSLLRSSKKLGRGNESKREMLRRALKERRAGIEGAENEDVLFEEVNGGNTSNSSDYESEDRKAESQQALQSTTTARETALPVPTFGGGLKRPLDVDEFGQPVITTRKRMKPTKVPKSWQVLPPSPPSEESDWSGFNSDSEDRQASEGKPDDGTSDVESVLSDTSGFASSEEDDGDNDEGSDAREGVDASEAKEALQERKSAFAAWASHHRNEAIGFEPSINFNITSMASTQSKSAPASNAINQSATSSTSTKPSVSQPYLPATTLSTTPTTYTIPVRRPNYIEDLRKELPIVTNEQQIMECINNNPITLITASTGSGKTTQVPQFLYEAGYGSPNSPGPGMIGVTQPRRVAAVSVARRVGEELSELDADDKHAEGSAKLQGLSPNRKERHVAHQVRFESNVSRTTRIKFMTDGILLHEASTDFTLSAYSAIILDEAHERSLNTDILLGLLPRVVSTRLNLSEKYPEKYKPLKLIIMSASLQANDFSTNKTLFNNMLPPVVEVEGRQYPVQLHWAKKTGRDYVEEAFQKIVRGHKRLPRGGMLVFMTGQGEISHLMKRLKEELNCTKECLKSRDLGVRVAAVDGTMEDEDIELSFAKQDEAAFESDSDSETSIHGVDNDDGNTSDASFDVPDDAAPTSTQSSKQKDSTESLKAHILPLYSQLSPSEQQLAFEPPPPNSRLIILATNVAETSLTIPDIRYIIDSGRAKQKTYSPQSGIQSFAVDFISKASADQRAGRAGRTGPGHVYRLYSSAVYEHQFAAFTQPEIARSPIEGVVLTLKSMGVPQVAKFPFPTPPPKDSLLQAERLLGYLGAVSSSDGKVTQVGKDLATYPLSPRLAKILVAAEQQKCLEHAVAMVAALAVPELFIQENQLELKDPESAPLADKEWTEADNKAAAAREKRRKAYSAFHSHASRLDRSSDAVKLLTTLCDYTQNGYNSPETHDFTRVKSLKEASQLREQLAAIVKNQKPHAAGKMSTKGPLKTPTSAQIQSLRNVVASGYIDQIAIRADLSATPPLEAANLKPKKVADVPYITLFPAALKEDTSVAAMGTKSEGRVEAERSKFVYVHPSSLLTHTTSPSKMPQYLVFSHLSRSAASASSTGRGPKIRIHPLVPISAEQIVAITAGTPLLEEGKPIGKIESMPRGEDGHERRSCWTIPFLVGEKGSMGWPLPPARKVVQRREKGQGWVVERVQS